MYLTLGNTENISCSKGSSKPTANSTSHSQQETAYRSGKPPPSKNCKSISQHELSKQVNTDRSFQFFKTRQPPNRPRLETTPKRPSQWRSLGSRTPLHPRKMVHLLRSPRQRSRQQIPPNVRSRRASHLSRPSRRALGTPRPNQKYGSATMGYRRYDLHH